MRTSNCLTDGRTLCWCTKDCSTRLVQSYLSFSFGKEGKKKSEQLEGQSPQLAYFFKRESLNMQTGKVIPYHKSTSKYNQENTWVVLSISQRTKPKKALKIMDAKKKVKPQDRFFLPGASPKASQLDCSKGR